MFSVVVVVVDGDDDDDGDDGDGDGDDDVVVIVGLLLLFLLSPPPSFSYFSDCDYYALLLSPPSLLPLSSSSMPLHFPFKPMFESILLLETSFSTALPTLPLLSLYVPLLPLPLRNSNPQNFS